MLRDSLMHWIWDWYRRPIFMTFSGQTNEEERSTKEFYSRTTWALSLKRFLSLSWPLVLFISFKKLPDHRFSKIMFIHSTVFIAVIERDLARIQPPGLFIEFILSFFHARFLPLRDPLLYDRAFNYIQKRFCLCVQCPSQSIKILFCRKFCRPCRIGFFDVEKKDGFELELRVIFYCWLKLSPLIASVSSCSLIFQLPQVMVMAVLHRTCWT